MTRGTKRVGNNSHLWDLEGETIMARGTETVGKQYWANIEGFRWFAFLQ